MLKLLQLLLSCLLSVALTACANQNSIFRNSGIGAGPRVLTMDAKQRNLIIVPDVDRARAWRVCGEASPDVFSALSTSAGADLGFGKSASGIDARARAALAISEAAGTVERTQTINLLRESMYRTCERYLSGAIPKEAFIIQAGRDQRAMVAILAIEQLTRAARPPATILIAGSTAATISNPGEFAAEISRTARAAETAKIRLETATAALDAAKCVELAADAPDFAARRARCDRLSADQADAETALRLADAERNAMTNAAATRPEALSATGASTGTSPSSAGGGGAAASAGDLAAVASAVTHIADGIFSLDETQLFCLQFLTANGDSPDEAPPPASPMPNPQEQKGRILQSRVNLKEECTKYALAKVKDETARLSNPGVKP